MSGHQNMKFTIVISYWHTSSAPCEKKMSNVIFICLLILSSFKLLFFTTTADTLFSWGLLFFVFSLSQLFLGRLSQGWLFKWFLLPRCLFFRWLAQGWWLKRFLLVSLTSGCLGDDFCDCCPIGGSLWSSFLTGVSSCRGVFFSSRNVIWFLFLFSVNKIKQNHQ